MNFDLLICDFDGTLCATREAICYCLSATFEQCGLNVPLPETIADTIGRGITLDATIRCLQPVLTDSHVERLIRTYRSIYNGGVGEERTRLYPGVHETLAALHRHGCKVVIISNKGEVAIHNALVRFAVAPFVQLVVGERPAVAGKPHPAPYVQVIKPAFPEIGCARTLVVGDTAADIRFARTIGAQACWAAYGYGDWTQCQSLNPDFTITDANEIWQLIVPDVRPALANQHDIAGPITASGEVKSPPIGVFPSLGIIVLASGGRPATRA